MTKNKKEKFGFKKIYLLLSISLIVSIFFAIKTFALDADVKATVDDADCFWSNGPGSELYVPDGKICTLTGTASAANASGFTDYAVIVYPGGTLIVGNNAVNSTLTVNGNILNMGEIYIGTGTAHAYNAYIQTIFSGGYIARGSTSSLEVRSNTGTGTNGININGGDVKIGTIDETDPVFRISDDSVSNSTGGFITYGQVYIDAGTMNMASLDVEKPNVSNSNFNIGINGEVTVNSSTSCILGLCSFTIASNLGTGSAALNVSGILTVDNIPAADVNVLMGERGRLLIEDSGAVYINETTTFGTPAPTSPSNYIDIRGDYPLYGLLVRESGTFDTDMFLINNGGYIEIDSGVSGPANLYARSHYKQQSDLYIAAGDTMTITGTADIDGDVQVDGTLDVSDCTKAMNDGTESFDVSATGVFDTGDGSCDLSNTDASDGLNIQGSTTDFNIANSATVTITGDINIDDYAALDAKGYFIATEDLIVQDSGTATLDDTDSGDDFEVDNLVIEPNSGTTEATVTVKLDTVLALKVGNVSVGTASSTSDCVLNVDGTLDIPTGNTTSVLLGEDGVINVLTNGTMNVGSDDPGLFRVYGGDLSVDGTLNITSVELQFENGPTETGLIEVSNTGLINSTATPASDRGFDYIAGNLDIANGTSGTTNGAMKFDDKIYITTSNTASIYGYLEGTDLIYHNGTGTVTIYPSGEMKVIGAGTPAIEIYRDLDLYGKLNADDGEGRILIKGSNSPVVGGAGGAGINSYAYIITGELTIESGASIDVSEFVESYDPGGSETYGGSYGGRGGGAGTTPFGETKYFTKPNYDTTTKNPVGMFGFTSGGTASKYGGGGIYIEVKKTFSHDGTIRANGQSTMAVESNIGAGSGGLIVIDHNITQSDTFYEFKGSGTIEANGGDGVGTTNNYGGGGGRIIIKSILFEEPDDTETGAPHYAFTGTVRARGGKINNGSTYGGAGTIVYLGDDNSPNDTLIVNQEDRTIGTAVVTNVRNDLFATDVFDRIEARNGANLKYINGPATAPISCFKSGAGSSVDLISMACTANPDKPDTLHVNNSYAGAQTGSEPWFGGTVTVNDLTPEFSIKPRNAETTASYNKVRVQITQDPAKFDNPANYRTCATCTWDADVTLDSSVTTNDNRSVDFEYAGPALTPGTYYIRVAFYDTAGTTLGLWTHRDMGNHYAFTISSTYFDISNDCSDLIEIRDVLAAGRAVGSGLRYSNGDRYGYGSCGFTINSTSTAWKVLYGMAPTVTDFEDTGSTYQISPIDNGVGDCTIDTSGNKSIAAEEEYGYNIADVSGTSLYVQTDSECSQDYDSWNSGTGNYVFDIETNALKDKILQNLAGTITNGQFDLFTYVTVDGSTPANTYGLDTWMVITTAP